MTSIEIKPSLATAKDLLSGDPEGLRILVQTIVQEVLEAEMTDALGAGQDVQRTLQVRPLASLHHHRRYVRSRRVTEPTAIQSPHNTL